MAARKSSSKLLATAFTAGFLAIAPAVADLRATPQAEDRAVNPKALALKEFSDRVKAYVALQEKLDKTLPPLKPTEDPGQVESHNKALAAAIRKERTAKPGDIFGSASHIVRDLVVEDAKDRTSRDAYAAMLEVPKQDPPMVNADYPEKTPLATVPPLLLKKLPPLLDGLEYRFMGRDLIIRDSKANLIVDFLREAVPIVGK
jgi:hypothetical protein